MTLVLSHFTYVHRGISRIESRKDRNDARAIRLWIQQHSNPRPSPINHQTIPTPSQQRQINLVDSRLSEFTVTHTKSNTFANTHT